MDSRFGESLGIVAYLLYVIVIVFYIYSMWRIYAKASKPGWAAIIPIYNVLVESKLLVDRGGGYC